MCVSIIAKRVLFIVDCVLPMNYFISALKCHFCGQPHRDRRGAAAHYFSQLLLLLVHYVCNPCTKHSIECSLLLPRQFSLKKMHRLAHGTISKMDWKCAMNGKIKCSAGWIAVEIEVCSITADGSTFDYGPPERDRRGCPHQREARGRICSFSGVHSTVRRYKIDCARSAVRTQLIARPFC